MSQNNDPLKSQYPAFGRWMMWVEKPGAPNMVFWAVAIVCAGLIALDFFYHKHTHFAIEELFGFYGCYGFFMCAALVIIAKWMRNFIMRDENYYAPKAVDSEEHPDFDLDKDFLTDKNEGDK